MCSHDFCTSYGSTYLSYSVQQWNILAPRIQRKQPIPVIAAPRTFRSRLLFNPENPWDAWSTLASPAALGQTFPRLPTPKQTGKLSAMECLPPELIRLILDELWPEKKDIISLGLASTTLWMHILLHVWRDFSRAMAPLAGVEIACVGSYLVDLPDAFVTGNLALSTVSICGCNSRVPKAARINRAAVLAYKHLEPSSGEAWRAALEAHNAPTTNIPAGSFRRLASELASTCSISRFCQRGTPWVLRNLTTREYVRCRPPRGAHMRSRAYVDHPDVRLRIDDVLLMRTSWTRSYTWEKESPHLHHGTWAGHCFDIVPLRQQRKLNVDDEWKDRTNDVVVQMVGVANDILLEGAVSLVRDVKSKRVASKAVRLKVGRSKRTSRRKTGSGRQLQRISK